MFNGCTEPMLFENKEESGRDRHQGDEASLCAYWACSRLSECFLYMAANVLDTLRVQVVDLSGTSVAYAEAICRPAATNKGRAWVRR